MKLAELLDEVLSGRINCLSGRRNGDKIAGVVALVGKEGSELRGRILGLVVDEFGIG